MNTGVYGAVAAFGASFYCPHYRRFAGRNSGYRWGNSDRRGLRVPALLLGAGFGGELYRFADNRSGDWRGGGYIIILARKFTIQSRATPRHGADVMMGAGNTSGRFLGPLIISAP